MVEIPHKGMEFMLEMSRLFFRENCVCMSDRTLRYHNLWTAYFKILWICDIQKTDGGILYEHILISAKLQIGKRSKNSDLTRKSPFGGEGPHWTVAPSK